MISQVKTKMISQDSITVISAKIYKVILNVIDLLGYTHDIIGNFFSKKLWGSSL
jgi:hypothetical protein